MLFFTPLDGFTIIAQQTGLSIARMVGYATVIAALPRLRLIIRSQPLAFWLWLLSASIGIAITVGISLRDGEPPEFELWTLIQMLGLWAIASHAFSSDD